MSTNQARKNLLFGVLAGLIVYMIIGSLGLYLLKLCWTDYAFSSKDKSYTMAMLLSRLFVGLLASITAGMIATKTAKDRGKSAWLAGSLIFCAAAYMHFVQVWNDYPVWYHFAYLFSIIPMMGLSHFLLRRRNKSNSENYF